MSDDAGAWIAYYSDWSAFSIFDSEMSALRYAVKNSMEIGFVRWGEELGGGRHPTLPERVAGP